jgi:hypothetical protein
MTIVRSLRSGLFIVATASACTATAPTSSQLPLLPGDSRVLHAVQSAQLRDAMDDLERITTKALPDTLERERERQSDLDEIAALADTLGRSAAEIPDALRTNGIPADEARKFRELAEQMVRDSFALRDRAILGEVGSARDETEQLLATCNACHAMSRVPPMMHATATTVAQQAVSQPSEPEEKPTDASRSRDARRRGKAGAPR